MFTIDRFSPVPLYEQLITQFERLILLGLLEPNAALPSVRALSQELSVNPNTIQKAYTELERRNLCIAAPGTGRFITLNAAEILRREKEALFDDLRALGEKLAVYGVSIEEAQRALAEGFGGQKSKGDEIR